MKNYYIYEFPIGKILIEQDNNAISKIQLYDKPNIYNNYTLEETELIRKAYMELQEYFNGKRKEFDFPLQLNGTQFQIKVWQELIKIPYGQTCSYKQISQKVQSPKGARAVGMANNRNSIMIVVPCHRVIGVNGKLVGYAGGIDIKKQLLDLEKRNS